MLTKIVHHFRLSFQIDGETPCCEDGLDTLSCGSFWNFNVVKKKRDIPLVLKSVVSF